MPVLTLFRQSRTALLLCGDDRRITQANAAAVALLGEPAEQLTGRAIEDLVTETGRAAAARELASLGAPGAAPDWLPFTLRTGQGAAFMAELTWRAEYLPGHHLVALRPAPATEALGAPARLTERERAILSRVARGETGTEIADGLFLSVATVERDVSAALRRLGARNRAHGIAIAVRTGQLEPETPAGTPARDEETAAIHGLALEALEGPAALLDGAGRVLVENAAWSAHARDGRLRLVARGEDYLGALDRTGSADPDAAQAAWGIREVLERRTDRFVHGYRSGPPTDERWLEMRVSPYGGSPQALLVRHRDITERHQAVLGAALLDEVDAAFAVAGLDGVVASWRPSAERMFGVAAADAVGRPIWEVVMEPRQYDVGRSVLREVGRAGRWAGELALVRADASPLSAEVRLRVVRDGGPGPTQIVAAAIDVTDRLGALRRSLDAQEELTAIMAGMGEGCLVLDASGRIRSANPAVTTLLGWPADELLGRSMHEVLRFPMPSIAPPGPPREGTDDPVHVERLITRDGRELPVAYTATRFASSDDAGRWALVFRPLPVPDAAAAPASPDAPDAPDVTVVRAVPDATDVADDPDVEDGPGTRDRIGA